VHPQLTRNRRALLQQSRDWINESRNLPFLDGHELVVAAGRYKHGMLTVDTISADLLATDPVAFFGPAADHFYIQAFARIADGRVLSSSGWAVTATRGLHDESKSGRPSVLELERRRDGSTVVTRFGDPSAGGGGPAGLSPSERGAQQPSSPGPASDLGRQRAPSGQQLPVVPAPDLGRQGGPAGHMNSPAPPLGGPGGFPLPAGGPGWGGPGR